MNPSLYRAAKPIFDAAAELPAAQQSDYVVKACADRPELRDFVLDLLATHRAVSDGGSLDRAVERTLAVEEGPGAVIDRFVLEESIGEGGFGTVWRAMQREPVRRPVALKVLKPGMDSRKVVARFEAERQALALMDHPHIAQVFDGGATANGRPYFAMELVDGVPVTEFCVEHELGLRARLDLFVQICGALQHAHQKGVIHRDVKPSNVLVTAPESVPVPKVIDFGIAKAIGGELDDAVQAPLTEQHQVIGTPEYMAPEQLDGAGDIDTRADVYALGALLYELLTGTRPFERGAGADAISGLLAAIRGADPQRPSERVGARSSAVVPAAGTRSGTATRSRSALRGDLDWIVLRALRKDRDERYESAGALAADVMRHLDDEPVLAGPPSTAYRLRKFVKRHRGGVLAAAAVLVTLVVGLIGTGLALQWAVAEKARAEERFELALDAVDDYHTGVTEAAILRRPELQPLREQLLQAPRGFYERLAKSLETDADPESRTALLRALEGLGTVALSVGDLAEAVASYDQAADLAAELEAQTTGAVEPRHHRARLLAFLGAAHLELGQLEAGIATLERTAELLRGLPVEGATAADRDRRLADVLAELGSARQRRGEDGAAAANWDEALALYRRIQQEGQNGEEGGGVGQAIGDALCAMGLLALATGRHEDANELFGEGVQLFEDLLARSESEIGALAGLLRCARGVGDAHRESGDLRSALTAYERSVAVGERLVAALPAVTEHRHTLGVSAGKLAAIEVQLRQFRSAGKHFARALELLADAETPADRRALAAALAKAAELAMARRDFDGALEQLQQAGEVLDELLAEAEVAETGLLDLAAACFNNLAGAVNRAGDGASAPAIYERAIALREQVIAASDSDAEQQLHLAASLLSLARLHFDAGRHAEGVPFYSRSIEVTEQLAPTLVGRDNPRFRQMHRAGYWGRANSFQRLKRYGESAQDWARAARIDAGKMVAPFLVQLLADLERGDLLVDLPAAVAAAVRDSGADPAALAKAGTSFLESTENPTHGLLAVALADEAVQLAERDAPDSQWRYLDLRAAAELRVGDVERAFASQLRAIEVAPAGLGARDQEQLAERLAAIEARRGG